MWHDHKLLPTLQRALGPKKTGPVFSRILVLLVKMTSEKPGWWSLWMLFLFQMKPWNVATLMCPFSQSQSFPEGFFFQLPVQFICSITSLFFMTFQKGGIKSARQLDQKQVGHCLWNLFGLVWFHPVWVAQWAWFIGRSSELRWDSTANRKLSELSPPTWRHQEVKTNAKSSFTIEKCNPRL